MENPSFQEKIELYINETYGTTKPRSSTPSLKTVLDALETSLKKLNSFEEYLKEYRIMTSKTKQELWIGLELIRGNTLYFANYEGAYEVILKRNAANITGRIREIENAFIRPSYFIKVLKK